ncbi:MAG: Ku protein [Thermoleophilia bacterium]
MPRPIWKGAISFGLVNVPVALFPAESRDTLRFRQLDRSTLSPVREQRVNEQTGREVAWADIVKGYEYEPTHFVVVSDEELETLDPRASHTIAIETFVAAAEIDPQYYDRPYYVAPTRGGEKGYALLREALKRSDRVAIAKVVIRTKEYLAAVVPVGKLLLLELLRYAHELRDSADLEIPDTDLEALGVKDKELVLAEQLIAAMVEPWRPEQYRDGYRDDILDLVRRKVEAAPPPTPPPESDETAPAQVIDIMSLLKESVRRWQDERTAAAPPTFGSTAARLHEE